MKLYLISRIDRVDYDEYDAFIVAAENEDSAFKFSPRGDTFENNKEYENEVVSYNSGYHGWTSKD